MGALDNDVAGIGAGTNEIINKMRLVSDFLRLVGPDEASGRRQHTAATALQLQSERLDLMTQTHRTNTM